MPLVIVPMGRIVLVVVAVEVVVVVTVAVVVAVAVVLLTVATLERAGDLVAELRRFVVAVLLVDSVSVVAYLMMKTKPASTVHRRMFQ